jgi:hypothetical protein
MKMFHLLQQISFDLLLYVHNRPNSAAAPTIQIKQDINNHQSTKTNLGTKNNETLGSLSGTPLQVFPAARIRGDPCQKNHLQKNGIIQRG